MTFDNGALVVPVTIAYFVGFCVVVWWMRFSEVVQTSSLAYFSGIALTFGAIFTGMGANSATSPTARTSTSTSSAL